MSGHEIDAMARQAAGAARAAVAPLATDAPTSLGRWSNGGDRRPPGIGRRMIATTVVISVAVLLLVFAMSRAGGRTEVSTVPATPAPGPTVVVHVPPTTGPPPPTPMQIPFGNTIEPPRAEGRTSRGQTWGIFIHGPSSDLCFDISVSSPDSRDEMLIKCADQPSEALAVDPDRPFFFATPLTPAFVIGRVPADVISVEVERATGSAIGPLGVIEADGGPFYAIELPDQRTPVAVVGHRADGTSVRFTQ